MHRHRVLVGPADDVGAEPTPEPPAPLGQGQSHGLRLLLRYRPISGYSGRVPAPPALGGLENQVILTWAPCFMICIFLLLCSFPPPLVRYTIWLSSKIKFLFCIHLVIIFWVPKSCSPRTMPPLKLIYWNIYIYHLNTNTRIIWNWDFFEYFQLDIQFRLRLRFFQNAFPF